jgi:hypothetical protein
LDLLLLIGSTVASSGPHLLHLCFSLKVADEGAIGGLDGVIYALDLLIEHVLEVLIGLRLGHEG